LLKELQDALRSGIHEQKDDTFVHLPMLLVSAKRWDHIPKGSSIEQEELAQVSEYIVAKERIRGDMDACIACVYNNMHHSIEAAFRFALLRSLPGGGKHNSDESFTLPVRASDDRVAQVARAHLYMMLAISKQRDMRTSGGDPIFSVTDDGLELANSRTWCDQDWVGFCMVVEVALSAERAETGKEEAYVPLLDSPLYMLSREGIIRVSFHVQDAESYIDRLATRAQLSYGSVPVTSFLQFGPTFSGPRCEKLLHLHWRTHRFLRTNSKAEDIPRACKSIPWKGKLAHIDARDRRAATEIFVKEYERHAQHFTLSTITSLDGSSF
jgi:hypothetical protein